MSELTPVLEAGTDGPQRWRSYMTKIYASRQPPAPLGTVNVQEIEEKAREVLKDHPGKIPVV